MLIARPRVARLAGQLIGVLYQPICFVFLVDLPVLKMTDHRSRKTLINWLFQFAPEKLGRFAKLCKSLSVF